MVSLFSRPNLVVSYQATYLPADQVASRAINLNHPLPLNQVIRCLFVVRIAGVNPAVEAKVVRATAISRASDRERVLEYQRAPNSAIVSLKYCW